MGDVPTLTDAYVDAYREISERAFHKAVSVAPGKTHLDALARDILGMVRAYLDDSIHFQKQGDLVRSFGAINYAHGWLDCGARIGLFDVGHDSTLFTVDEKD